ncbi:MAG TPA: hypothetical protein VMW17_01055 [Candidatus Binatia bacterium]|nr:hypothetical protein [Candidatus Binatia bacterium]
MTWVVRALLSLCVMLAGCALLRAPAAKEEVLFGGTLQELVPHHHGDHFVYRVAGKHGNNPLQVEHLSQLDAAGEFILDLTVDGVPAGRQHLRDDGTSVLLISEGWMQQGVIVSYDPPLPGLAVPLTTATRRATAAVTMQDGRNGKVVARGRVEQTSTASRPAGDDTGVFAVRTVRAIQLTNSATRLAATTWIKPGIGEVRSDGVVDGGPRIRRELLCAIVDGTRMGDKCDQILSPAPENPQ